MRFQTLQLKQRIIASSNILFSFTKQIKLTVSSPIQSSFFPFRNQLRSSLSISRVSSMACFLLFILLVIFQAIIPVVLSHGNAQTCRSYCGNLTVDYPFATQSGCGHPGFRDLLFCINDVLMFHISSGSYRVLDIDYAYQSLTLHDPHMSTCDSIVLGGRGNGFVVEQWRSPFLIPTTDNVFMLIECSPESPLFEGFPGKHLPCGNVSGMGCEEYYNCPAWDIIGPKRVGPVYGSGPPECCAVSFEAIKAVNLTKLGCQGYSSAYSLAPLRLSGPDGWSYGIRVKYSIQGNEAFCKACEATGGTCGFDIDGNSDLCMCGSWNSTSNCDSVHSTSDRIRWTFMDALAGLLMTEIIWRNLPSLQ